MYCSDVSNDYLSYCVYVYMCGGSSQLLFHRVDVAFIPPGHPESDLVTVSFPNTAGWELSGTVRTT